MKKIKEREQRENQKGPEMKLASKLEVLSSRSFFPSVDIYSLIKGDLYLKPAVANPVDRAYSIFHPPQA
jgi:hypothetical protein